MKRLALILGMAAAVMPASAEWTNDIDFESEKGYKSISMYDCWEQSPFRTGALRLIPRVVSNPDNREEEMIQGVPNDSENVAGAQRSRFGSNRFGLRVDLSEDNYFELTPTVKYVHVKLLKPTEGRVMLVGLGSRNDVPDQDPYVEQFWSVSQNSCFTDKWSDMVFAIKGAGGITMRSFVLVPDLESPHNYTSDFLFYIDDIKVNQSASPEIKYEYYRTSNDKATAVLSRNDRYTTFVELQSPKYGTQRIATNQQVDRKAYQNLVGEMPLVVEAGETVTPVVGYAATWMNSCVFLDKDRNGRFDVDDPATTELIAQSPQGQNNHTLPSFKMPDLEPGLYRMRFKVDWNDLTPEGRPGDANVTNSLLNNGGVIADVMVNVVAPGAKASVNDFQLNGEILAADGSKLTNYEVAAMQDFEVLVAPENGFENNGFTLKCGYGTIDAEGEANRYDKYGNPNWFMVDFPLFGFAKDDNYKMIPAKYMFGNVLLQGRMAEVGTREPYYNVNFDKATEISRTDRHLDKITLTPAGGEAQEISLADNANPRLVYVEKLETPVKVSAGKKVSVDIAYTGRAMHHYLYVDYDDNGYFNAALGSDGLPAAGSELVSFSCYEGKNSKGDNFSNMGNVAVTSTPDFIVPADLPDGYYRARLKTDWNNINPGARDASDTSNKIWDNGGAIVDFILQVGEPVFAESITLSETVLALKAGETRTLEATVLPENTSNPTVRWSSSDRAVVTVNTVGEVIAVGAGEAVITAKCGDATAECSVTVTEVFAESIEVSEHSLDLNAGETAALTVSILPENTYNKKVKWSTSDSTVATVSSEGVVSAVGGGSAVITATCGKVSDECNVTVTEVYAKSIVLSEEQLNLPLGRSATLTGTVMPEDTYNKTIVWTSSNEQVATVSSAGVVSSTGVGTAVIKATCGEAVAECQVTVTAVAAESIVLSKTETTITVDDYEILTATVLPAETYNKSVTWTSADESIASVDVNGVVSAISEGTTTITATCGDATAECVVTVLPKEIVAVEEVLLSAPALSLEVGKSETLTATVLPENATFKTVEWASSNSVVATVTAGGLVTALSEGNAIISASCGEAVAECLVTVTAPAGEEDSITEILSGDSDAKAYDLLGRRVLKPSKGSILIVNGKSVKL